MELCKNTLWQLLEDFKKDNFKLEDKVKNILTI